MGFFSSIVYEAKMKVLKEKEEAKRIKNEAKEFMENRDLLSCIDYFGTHIHRMRSIVQEASLLTSMQEKIRQSEDYEIQFCFERIDDMSFMRQYGSSISIHQLLGKELVNRGLYIYDEKTDDYRRA